MRARPEFQSHPHHHPSPLSLSINRLISTYLGFSVPSAAPTEEPVVEEEPDEEEYL